MHLSLSFTLFKLIQTLLAISCAESVIDLHCEIFENSVSGDMAIYWVEFKFTELESYNDP